MRNRDADHPERLISVGVNSPRNIGPFNTETNYGWIDITQCRLCDTPQFLGGRGVSVRGDIKTELASLERDLFSV